MTITRRGFLAVLAGAAVTLSLGPPRPSRRPVVPAPDLDATEYRATITLAKEPDGWRVVPPADPWTPTVVACACFGPDGQRNPTDRDVPALALAGGIFAVHRMLSRQAGQYLDGWTVTHVPTGFAAVSDAPTEEAARRAAVALAAVEVDWANHEPTLDAFRAWPPDVQARVKAIVAEAST